MDQASFDPVPGKAEWLEPGIRRVLAPNPSPMTYRGTNTYLLGEGAVAVIDPGPAIPAHLQAIVDALQPGERISHIFVTHSHLDHSPLAAPLSAATGAAIHAFGDSMSGRSALMESLARAGQAGGGEGVDSAFAPQVLLRDGASVAGKGWTLTALWTPGHFGNHLSFEFGDAVFTGDLIMGWASSLVSPPDGDLTAFMASTRRLAARDDRVFYPGHGAPVDEPKARAEALISHRLRREAEILSHLGPRPKDIATLACAIYTDTPARLLPAAERNVFAHLIDLHARNLASAVPRLAFDARFLTKP